MNAETVTHEQKMGELRARMNDGNCHIDFKPSDFFPEGRTMYYEGGNVKEFRRRLLIDFAYDPGEDCEHGFYAPPKILDALYDDSNGYGPIGS